MIKRVLLLLGGLLSTGIVKAQLTPPGLEGAKAVGWVAIGLTQTLSQRWSLGSYVGTSTQSTLNNYYFWHEPAISVLNQEVAYRFNHHWQLVVGGSVRFQALYEEDAPYEPIQPYVRDEVRTYGRLFFRHTQNAKLSWVRSFRPEYRRFYTPDWRPWPNPFQIRLRWKSQLSYALNPSNTTQFIAANEVLTALDRLQGPSSGMRHWGTYRFTEDRLSMFVRRVMKKPAINVDVGLMHQFWRNTVSQKIQYTTYVSIDVVLRDPFKRVLSNQERPTAR